MARFALVTMVLALCVSSFLAPSLNGQARGSMTSARRGGALPGVGPHRPSFGISGGEGRRQRAFRRGSSFYGYGAPYYWGYDESYEPEPRPEPPSLPGGPVPEIKSAPLPDPVLLELRGNQWVRVTTFGTPAESGSAPQTSAQAESKAPSAFKGPSAFKADSESAPALLVYRDGHTEEVSSYSIIGQTMYTKSDFWSSGSWTRTIQIADLDVPATLKQNQQRGVRFELPSGPDEVMIRP